MSCLSGSVCFDICKCVMSFQRVCVLISASVSCRSMSVCFAVLWVCPISHQICVLLCCRRGESRLHEQDNTPSFTSATGFEPTKNAKHIIKVLCNTNATASDNNTRFCYQNNLYASFTQNSLYANCFFFFFFFFLFFFFFCSLFLHQ